MLAGASPSASSASPSPRPPPPRWRCGCSSTLGEWVTLDDAALTPNCARSMSADRRETARGARALFADVLDLPGGMRIGTIHAFCQSLLRRFPLEAALSPHFRLVEDRDADGALAEAREDDAGGCRSAALREAMRDAGRACASVDQFGRPVATLQTECQRLRRRMRLGRGAGGCAAPGAGRDCRTRQR